MISQDIIVSMIAMQWTYCNMTEITANSNFISIHVLVWKEDGEELLMLTSVQKMIVRVSGGRPHNLVLASAEWPLMIVILYAPLPNSLLME